MSSAIDISRFADVIWSDVRLRHQCLPGLDARVLLHAGPPIFGPMPQPIRHAAAQAILFEGAARDMAAALSLLDDGTYILQPAQDADVVTPLAQVVSHSMPLAVVRTDGLTAYGALVEGGPPALRFGTIGVDIVARLAILTAVACDMIAPALRQRPLPLADVVQYALANGDECHARTGMANLRLLARLAQPPGTLEEAARAFVADNPGFALPVLMAAAKVVLLGAGAGMIHSVGGNGVSFGIRLQGETRWRTIAAAPPVGTRFAGDADSIALGAIGDSAVIDYAGLGAQALTVAPELGKEWAHLLSADPQERRAAIIDPVSGLVSPARIRASGQVPLVNLALVEHAGVQGLIGRGFYTPDADALAAALDPATAPAATS